VRWLSLLGVILIFLESIGGVQEHRHARLIFKKTVLPLSWGVIGQVVIVLVGCFSMSAVLHEPVPRIHDEFSYTLMGDTFSHGRLAEPTPPLPEFFDTFHELMRPVYASKYLPAQGIFLAFGEKLTGHPAAGVWLSSALACAATYWMLIAWVGLEWALFGASLML